MSTPKYNFPVNRFLLTRDPKERSVAGNGLGMRVIGGKETTSGALGAFVARIYPGGVAERAGDIREGDQVLEWNGVALTGRTFEEVQSILAQSVEEVEVVIRSRPPSPCPVDVDRGRTQGGDDGRRKFSDTMTVTEPPASHEDSTTSSLGELNLQVCYDKQASILYLIVHRARKLPLVPNRLVPPDPYIKVYLLPGRNLENQRRTKACSRTTEPEWNQTMVYEGVCPEELPTRYLEVTAWNYDVSKPNPAMGGVLLDLSDSAVLAEEPGWYSLMDGPALQAALSRLTSKRSVSIYGSGPNSPLLMRAMSFFDHLFHLSGN